MREGFSQQIRHQVFSATNRLIIEDNCNRIVMFKWTARIADNVSNSMRVPTFYSWRGEVTAYVRRIRLNVANRSTCDCITLNTDGNALGIKSKVRVFSKVCHSEY